MTITITDPTAVKAVLETGLDHILTYGWAQMDFGSPKRPTCALGAVGTWVQAESLKGPLYEAQRLLNHLLPDGHYDILRYNDDLPFTVEGMSLIIDMYDEAIDACSDLEDA